MLRFNNVNKNRCPALLRSQFILLVVMVAIAHSALAVDVSIVPIDNAFAANSMNHVSFRQSSIMTVGSQQFVSYYDDAGLVTVARRMHDTSVWEVFNTSYLEDNSGLSDDHNVIAFGVDGDGYMHLSWGMHNDNLRYIKSNQPVTGASPIAFGSEILMTGSAEGLVTYPQFYNVPNGDLLFTYRTGGSGNGDTQVNRYNLATDSWVPFHRPLFDANKIDGVPGTVNSYPNKLAFDSQGDIHMSWTNRDTPDFQTNENIYYARSSDSGATWTESDGTPLSLPLSAGHAELAIPIPQGSSLINQTSMTVDQNDNPVIASWWAPAAQQGDHTRQYMLAYHDGVDWQTSQITNRAFETQTGGGEVRDLGRPIVMVDDDDRTIVVMRYDEHSNVITVAHSLDKQNWDFIDLTTEDMGTYEPSYDIELWQQENKLHMLYQPVGLGQGSSPISVLEWDAKSYFAELGLPKLSLLVDRFTGQTTIVNEGNEAIELDAYTIASAAGQLGPSEWQSLASQGVAGWQSTTATAMELSESSGTHLSFSGQSSASLGSLFSAPGSGIAFGVDGNEDLDFSCSLDGESPIDGSVTYIGKSSNNLTLLIDPNTGEARLINTSTFNVDIEAYTISSESGALLFSDGNWFSLDDANEGGGVWSEANPGSTRVSELIQTGVFNLSSEEAYTLGALFDTMAAEDLIFEFLIAGESTTNIGVVRYVSLAPPLYGDYNNDGIVDSADYTVWRDALGTFEELPNDLTPGLVTIADFDVWRDHFGETLAATSNSSAVPEPGALLFVASAALLAGIRRSY